MFVVLVWFGFFPLLYFLSGLSESPCMNVAFTWVGVLFPCLSLSVSTVTGMEHNHYIMGYFWKFQNVNNLTGLQNGVLESIVSAKAFSWAQQLVHVECSSPGVDMALVCVSRSLAASAWQTALCFLNISMPLLSLIYFKKAGLKASLVAISSKGGCARLSLLNRFFLF